ncbi:MAG: NADAR family protein [Myxococcales bacterium]|nr:NADAR family protein [Myxococcales bacterium]
MDLQQLQSLSQSGKRLKYLFFWGHQAEADGSIGSGCLSQWWGARFNVDGTDFPSAEHFMMAEKARLFRDEEALEQILGAKSPGAAKRFGRHVRGFGDAAWEAARFDIVVRGNAAKFAQDQALTRYLLATGDRILVEASPKDRIWGIGLSKDDLRAQNPLQWRGLNLLGFALMKVREELRSKPAANET